MSKGPKFNDIKMNFTTRDCLGIEGATTSIQRELCPVVNTVTPRAFYWIFMVWNYYDFYKNYKGKKENYNDFDKPFLKKNDYYFVLSNLMNENSDQNNLVGKDKASQDLENISDMFPYNENYFVSKFGGMQYYNAGCLTLGFITETNQDGSESYKLPRLTKEFGEPMALAFENVIKNTEYYKNYRLLNTVIPRNVLEEFGKVVSLDLSNFSECKRLLREALFVPKNNIHLDNKKLIESKEYLIMLHQKKILHEEGISRAELREILFDYFSPRGKNIAFDSSLKEIISEWEIVIGRQYLTISIELIWKYMLERLNSKSMPIDLWINDCLNSSEWMDLDKPVKSIIHNCNYSFEERETMIAKGARGSKNTENNIENAIKIMLSIYNRFVNREDVNLNYLDYGGNVSISSLIDLVNEFFEKPIGEFAAHIMANWIVKQHEKTAFEKILYGRDGYYIENIEGVYVYKHDMYPDFQGIRLIQLNQVMKDLDMFEENA